MLTRYVGQNAKRREKTQDRIQQDKNKNDAINSNMTERRRTGGRLLHHKASRWLRCGRWSRSVDHRLTGYTVPTPPARKKKKQ